MSKMKPPARRSYDTDLSDVRRELIAPMIPDARAGWRPRKATSRELVNAILYFLRAGPSWRLLPHAPRRGRRSTIICAAGRGKACGSTSITPSCLPIVSVAAERRRRRRRSLIASRSAWPIKRGDKGYDTGKKITGRKSLLSEVEERHPDRHHWSTAFRPRPRRQCRGTRRRQATAQASRQRFPFVARVFADGGYADRLVHRAADKTRITLEIIRLGPTKGFEVLPQRWVAECAFAWIFNSRRPVRDYEQITSVAGTLITIAASATLLRRWA